MRRIDQRQLYELIRREFLMMPLRPSTMTFYTVRTSILRSVERETASFHGSVLDIGCGFMPYRTMIEGVESVQKYTGMDLEQSAYSNNVEPHLKWDGHSIPTSDESFDCVIATELLEHCAQPESVLTEIYRVLKPGGKFFATVPFIWNLHEIPHDEYRYTPFSLERHLSCVGFDAISVKPLGGWNMALAQMLGLWLGFSRMHRATRAIFRILLFPIYALLVLTDRIPDDFDGNENSMFSGLRVLARKENAVP
jgi:SAM-dependent methyltransferase